MTDQPSDADRQDQDPAPHPYLLDGRRVTIGDLLKAGLLTDRTPLVFHRKKKKETHRAEVTTADGGGIRLPASDKVFRSPSRAAKVAVGYGSFDGWFAWQLPDGPLLDDLRQELLARVAEEASSAVKPVQEDATPRPTATQRHELLQRARQAADDQRPQSLSVRELLGWWGASSRGLIRDQMETDLGNHGLITSPNFEQVGLDAVVELKTAIPEVDGGGQEAAADDSTPGAPDYAARAREPGPTVGTIASAMGGVTTIAKGEDLDAAVTTMLLNDFSQLPVMSGKHHVVGAVTWKSIAQARHRDPGCTLADALVKPSEVRYDHELIDVLLVLAASDFVLVRGPHNDVVGIVTVSDVALAYGSLASPFLLVGELDQRLRTLISDRFDISEVAEVCGRNGRQPASHNALTFGDYVSVLRNEQCWQQLRWPLDQKMFVRRLDEIRKVRNDLMHFNPDPIPPLAVDQIRAVIDILRNYCD
ncbi:restriction system modified-DNA reader domain-containing protein [Streptomyces sp. NPDC002454]